MYGLGGDQHRVILVVVEAERGAGLCATAIASPEAEDGPEFGFAEARGLRRGLVCVEGREGRVGGEHLAVRWWVCWRAKKRV